LDKLRFADNLDGEAVVALGLPAPRLILAGLGAGSAWAIAEMALPVPLRLGMASLVALATVALAWERVQGVSLARWAWLCLGYLGRLILAGNEEPAQRVDAELSSDRLSSVPGRRRLLRR
jgi:hypothetical protein